MRHARETEHLVRTYLKNLSIPERAEVDRKILPEALMVMKRNVLQQEARTSRLTWQEILASKAARLVAIALVVAVILGVSVFSRLTRPVWALSEAIQALQGFGAVHMVGTVMDEYGAEKGIELWMRADRSRTGSKDVVARLSSGVIQWVQDGSTYTYIPQNNTLYHENAITAGAAQWLGPSLLEQFRNAEGSRVFYGTDPATGRRHVTLTCSLYSALGPQSFSIDFDMETKLPVAMTIWNNMERRGAPGFRAWQITYYEDLPNSVFAVEYPPDARKVEKDLTIPESALALLIDPRSGIPTNGISMEEASRKILRLLYQAIIDRDVSQIRRLCPALSAWNDELIKALILGPEQRPVRVVEIRPISKRGYSRLGPLVAVACIVKTQTGITREDKIIVQFRGTDGKTSCVVYGPYGQSRILE